MRLLRFSLLALCATPLLPAQTPSDLDLQIRPEQILSGIPQAFSFVITNHSHHLIRLPRPILECSGNYTGSIWLMLHFVPANGSQAGRGGRGCAADKFGWPPILKRVQEWEPLAPGQSMTLHAGKADLFYRDQEPGSYEFWATYTPPSVSGPEQQTLRAAGYFFASNTLTSQHLTFKKQAR